MADPKAIRTNQKSDTTALVDQSSRDGSASVNTMSPAEESALWRRVARRLLPICGLAYLISYIDRVNLGYVGADIANDLNLTITQLGLAAGLFFVGYVFFEVPSNLALRRFGARRWIMRILVTWGFITVATSAVIDARTLYLARILLGVAEAGLAAGLVLYLTFWFPSRLRGWALSLFFLSLPISSILGAPLTTLILKVSGHFSDISPWRWLFIIEGIITIAIGILVYVVLPDGPEKAKWLSASEKRNIKKVLDKESEEQAEREVTHGALRALRSRKIWGMSLTFFSLLIGLYPISFFLPAIITGMLSGVEGAHTKGILLSVLPNAVAIICMLVWPRVCRHWTPWRSVAVPWAIGACGIILAGMVHNPIAVLILLSIGVSGTYTAIPQFWPIPALRLAGAGAAAGIALINSIANTSGFFGPYLTGFLRDLTGGFGLALIVIGSVMICGLALLFSVQRETKAQAEDPNNIAL